jgi:Zn-dependent protease
MDRIRAYLSRLTTVQWLILILIVGFFLTRLLGSLFSSPATFVARIAAILVAFSIHEFAHAWTADMLGDDTPRRQGRLTLDPRVHLDIVGTLALLFTGFGWAKPVQVDAYTLQRRSPYGMLLVSLAGPLSNLLLAIAIALPLKIRLIDPLSTNTLVPWLPTLGSFLTEFIFINIVLFLFNLLPVFPLDGEKVAVELLPPDLSRSLVRMRPYAPFILLIFIFIAPQILGFLIGRPSNWLLQLLVI